MQGNERGPNWPPYLFSAEPWQMLLGERVALEGLLATLRPALAIEIGRAEGGSLARIAKYSQEVHTIDIVAPDAPLPAHVHHHGGDSREVLPALLDTFEAAGRNVDFVLLDGDHSSHVIRVDVANLLRSGALKRTLIVMHDTMNEDARAGIESVSPENFEKVRFVDLDFLTGAMIRVPPFEDQLWGGFGVIVVDAGSEAGDPASDVAAAYRAHRDMKYDAYEMIERVAETGQQEQDPTQSDSDAARAGTQQMTEPPMRREGGGGGLGGRSWLAPLSGIAFLVVAIAGLAIGGEPPSAGSPVDEIVSHYTENEAQIYAAGILAGLAAALFIIFAATLSGAFRHGSADSNILPSAVLAGGAVLAAGIAIDGTISVALADKADEIEPASVQALQALWDNDFLPLAVGTLVFMTASGLAILSSGALPRWLGWVAPAFAVLTFTPVFYIGLIGTAVWIAIVSALLTRQARPVAAAPPA